MTTIYDDTWSKPRKAWYHNIESMRMAMDCRALYYLARQFWLMGEKDKAREYCTKAKQYRSCARRHDARRIQLLQEYSLTPEA